MDFSKVVLPRDRLAANIAQWRVDGCCTQCGNKLFGNADILDEHGVKFFGGKPHLIGDRVCFWCIFEDDWREPPSRFQWGHA